MKPLHSTLMALVPYSTCEEDVHGVDTIRQQSLSPIEETPNVQGLNLEKNLVRTSPETVLTNTKAS